MKIVCAWCEEEGKPALVREDEPLDDPSVVDGVCGFHRDWFVAQIDAAPVPKR